MIPDNIWRVVSDMKDKLIEMGDLVDDDKKDVAVIIKRQYGILLGEFKMAMLEYIRSTKQKKDNSSKPTVVEEGNNTSFNEEYDMDEPMLDNPFDISFEEGFFILNTVS